jgi:hypothetical protein
MPLAVVDVPPLPQSVYGLFGYYYNRDNERGYIEKTQSAWPIYFVDWRSDKRCAAVIVTIRSKCANDSAESRCDLLNGNTLAGELYLKFTLTSESTPVFDPPELAEDGLSMAKLESPLARLKESTSTLGSVGSGIGAVVALEPSVRSAAKNINNMAATMAPLNDAIRSLDQLVRIVDGIAEVSALVEHDLSDCILD